MQYPSPTDSILPTAVASQTVFLSIALLTLGLRLYTRSRPTLRLGWDDLAIVIGTCLAVATWALAVVTIVVTKGRHTMFVSFPEIERVAYLSFFVPFTWLYSATFVKLSVALMLWKIRDDKRWRIGLGTLIAVLVVSALALTIAQLLMCRPVRASWDVLLRLQPGNCWDIDTQVVVSNSLISLFIFTDIVCSLLPIAFIRKINRPLREKVVLAFLMGLGLIASALGIVRVAIFRRIMTSTDPMWEGPVFGTVSYLELYIGITAANIPPLKAFLERMLKAAGVRLTAFSTRETRPSFVQSIGSSFGNRARSKTQCSEGESWELDDEAQLRGKETFLQSKSMGSSRNESV